MIRKALFLFLIAGLMAGCSTSKDSVAGSQTFGETFRPKKAMTYEELRAKMAGQDSLAATLTGTVVEVCQVKGCWMTIASKDAGVDPIMVRFKDYGFFMPKDISGRPVVMNGYAFRNVTTVEELRHYAEDAGKSKAEIEAITAPKEELQFLASGVILLNGQK